MSLFWSQWGGDFYTERWVRSLASEWRVDVVRAALGVSPDGYLDHRQRELAKIETVIEAAIQNDVYVIIDWHSHQAFTSEAVLFFAALGERYRDIPNVIWESWNEPLPDDDWGSIIKPHHESVIEGLRKAGSNGVVICGTGSHCRDVDVAAAAPIEQPNVAYALHFYAGSHRQGLRDKARQALDRGACIFASEYGLGEADGDGLIDLAEIKRWWQFLEQEGISHLNWSLFDKNEACAALRPALSLLVRRSYRLSQSGRVVRRQLVEMASGGASFVPTRRVGD